VPKVTGAAVLEVGCGEGYGTAMIAHGARTVLGLDYDEAAVRHAQRSYPGAHFARANLAALPIRSEAVDAVVTLQVIEHVWDHPQFVRECARVVRRGGQFIVTTPNRLTFSPGLDTPINPFHTHEFTGTELVGLVERCGFEVTEVLALHSGDRIGDLDDRYGSFTGAQLASPPEQWSAELAGQVAAIGIEDFVVLSDEVRPVDAGLDLIVVAQARG
jgi:SAM-dependent methyltransferase